jgi:hypothetical protein
MPYTRIQLVFDATAPEKLGPFWALALGYVMDPIPPGFDTLEDFFRRCRRETSSAWRYALSSACWLASALTERAASSQ